VTAAQVFSRRTSSGTATWRVMSSNRMLVPKVTAAPGLQYFCRLVS
jgi:hypothetical protein